jgi:RHS repeat-associated protein
VVADSSSGVARLLGRNHRGGQLARYGGAALVALLLAAWNVMGLAPGALAAANWHPPSVAHDKSVPVSPVISHYQRATPMRSWHPAAPSWPSGTGVASLGTAPGAPVAAAGAGAASAASRAAAPGGPARAASLPVWAAPVPGHGPAVSKVSISLASRDLARSLGINGVVLTAGRADGGTTTGTTRLSLSYASYADAFGGDWASRLRLVELPGCALTTPQAPSCRVETPLRSANDSAARTVSAQVTLPPAGQQRPSPQLGASPQPLAAALQAAPSSGVVVAATSDPGGGAGDYTATSLRPSGSWQAGGSNDSFTWSYPMTVPPVPGGLAPALNLGYDSQGVDGLTSSTNNQPSAVGDGWSMQQSFIERSYASCHQNPAGATQTYDNCWSGDNQLTLSLNGTTTTLIKDDSTGVYHPTSDGNERVQYETGAANAAQNGEYWVITTTNGTQYYFGLNQLPGYASGDTATNSVWTEPVFATASGQPCYKSTWADSWCQQAYRWNLDYVKDAHGDVVSYFYGTETNYYARDLGTTANTPYVRGGYLSKIWYGQRDGSVYSTSPAGEVTFTVNGRCDTSPTGCNTSTLTSSTAPDWPDVPYDLNCANGASCTEQAPSFWSENEVTGIQTTALVGSTETNADSWALTYAFPATGDTTKPALWLSTITRTGQDTSAGPSMSPIKLPAVTFTGREMANRVNLTEGYPPITRQRLNKIVTETGQQVNVSYSSAACTTCTPSDDSQNTTLAYPDYWTPTGLTAPIKDYFNKYVVTSVQEQDPTGGSANDTVTTTYTPVGSPAWHYNDNPLTPSAQRTWDQWRGYQGMTVSTGASPDPVTKTTYTYFRGMDGDTLPGNGTRSVPISDSRGDPAVTDSSQFSGQAYETQVFNGASRVTDTITSPWSSAATATHALSGGLPSQQAFLTGTADTKVYTALAAGGERETETSYTHDSYGRVTKVNDLGDVSTSSDDLCTTTSYADNTTAWILDAPAEVSKVSVNCSTTPALPADAVSDQLTFYDGSTTLGAAPSKGDVTKTEKAASYTGSTPNYIATSTNAVDGYGRVTSTTDADNRATTTAYTPATGAEPTSIAVTDPLKYVTTTTYDPIRDLKLVTTTPAGYVTTLQYDALGRLTAVYKPGEAAPSPPNEKYSYTISDTGPSVVNDSKLNDDGSFRLSETLYDSMLRAREVQQQTVDGGRLVTDTMYNTDGWKSESTDPYYNSGGVSPVMVQAQAGQVRSATGYAYDGAGRQTAAISYALGTETWRTTTSYGGNFTTTVPPAGGTATTSVTNARGQLTDLIQYHAGQPADYVHDPASAYDDTRYTYYPGGQKATQADPGGNAWSWQYDLFGDQTQAIDPDTGTSAATYDNVGQQLTSTDARGKKVTTSYDADGRVTATYDTTTTKTLSASNQLTGYTYDTLKKGYITSSTSYSGGDTYTYAVEAYSTLALPVATKVTLTGEGTTLVPAAGYVTSYGYGLTGTLTSQQDPASGGLPSEKITYGHDQFGHPTSVAGSGGASWSYVTATGYDEYGDPVNYTFGPSTSQVAATLGYDAQTLRLTEVKTTDSTSSGIVDDLGYTFGNPAVSAGSGLLTKTTDSQNGGTATDTQCFTYDYAQRVTQAWTATDGCAATPSPGNSSTVGGTIAPYWQSWTYNASGSRATQADHDVTGNTANDTTTTYNYPAQGSATDQPHTLTSTTSTGPQAAANTASYTYNAGDTTSISGGALGAQALTWNTLGQLATDQTSTGTTSYAYGYAGNLIVQRDPGTTSTTLYTGDEQLVLNTSAGTVSGTRYYTIGGGVIAARTSSGTVDYLIPDRQGTSQLAINASSQAVTRRSYLPFGGTRGAAPAAWPGDKGYVGGTLDAATSLENLGAREYDPVTGRFISPDPVFEATSPQQTNGYDYAGNNPVTSSDPTGLCPKDECDPGINEPGQNGAPVLGTPAGDGNGTANTGDGSTGSAPPTGGSGSGFGSGGGCQYAHLAGGTCALLANADNPIQFGYGLINGPMGGPCLDQQDPQWACGNPRDPTWQIGFWTGTALTLGLSLLYGQDPSEDPTPTGCSFAPATLVLLEGGKSIPISDLKPGDKVLATNTTTGKTQAETVAAVEVNHDTDLYDLNVKTSHGIQVIHTTSNHLFWDPYPHYGWIPANHLKPGIHLKTPDGQSAVVVGGSVPAVHDGWMWDLTVPGNNDHDFYVAVAATAVLVHNIDCERVAQQTLGPNSGSGVSLERGDSFTQEEQQLINESGDANGCSTCDATKSGWKDGHWTVDHQPPNKLAPNGPWTGYPQCAACARQQGGIVRTILQEMYDFPPELSMGDS